MPSTPSDNEGQLDGMTSSRRKDSDSINDGPDNETERTELPEIQAVAQQAACQVRGTFGGTPENGIEIEGGGRSSSTAAEKTRNCQRAARRSCSAAFGHHCSRDLCGC